MEFIDNSGHIFSLNDYKQKPIGYEYDETPYVFWINDQNNNGRLSINMYYGKVINILYELENYDKDDLDNNENLSDFINIEISLNSKVFKFIKCVDFQNAINANENLFDYISLINNEKSSNFTDTLTSDNDDDLCVVKFYDESSDKCYCLIPLYVVGITSEPGTWSSNILVHIWDDLKTIDKWCHFSVGGTFVDEYECLTIHGKNMGVDLPKDILKAIYSQSFYEETFNEELYNKKIKEYMLNYIDIYGERGNYNSAIKSLKWFGYGDNLTLYRLLRIDNEYIDQFIRDDFNIYNDINKTFRSFIYTKFVSLSFKINEDLKDDNGNLIRNNQNFNDIFYGEGNLKTRNLFDKVIIKETNEYFEHERFKYLDSYYKYSFYELSFKLSALVYYYQKYFLPIYLKIKNLTLEYKVYANDIKYDVFDNTQHFFEHSINIMNEPYDLLVFPKYNSLYFYNQNLYVDKYFNLIKTKDELNENDTICPIYETLYKKWYLADNGLTEEELTSKDQSYFDGLQYNQSTKPKNGSIIKFHEGYNIIVIPETWSIPIISENYKFTTIYNPINLKNIYEEKNIKNPAGKLLLVYECSNDLNVYIKWDDSLNENNDDTLYDIHDSCIYVPITINEKYKNKIYNISFFLTEKLSNKLLYSSSFNLYESDITKYRGFVFYPKFIDNLNNNRTYDVINKEFIIYLIVNNTWYSYEFKVKIPTFDIEIGTIEYKYWINDVNFLNSFYKESDNKNMILYSYDLENKLIDNINITKYIKDKDYLNNPIKFISPFSQINSITDDEIKFNSYMFDTDFVNINDINWGFKHDINELVKLHNSKVDLASNNKLLNQLYTYDLYECKDVLSERNEIKFKKNISLRCGGYTFNHNFYDIDKNSFIISGNNNQEIKTKDGIDTYTFVEDEQNLIKDNKLYYYFVKRTLDENKNYITLNGEYSLQPYNIIPDKDENNNDIYNYVGYVIYDVRTIKENNLSINNIIKTDLDKNDLSINNNHFIHKKYDVPLSYKSTFVIYNGLLDEYEEIDSINSKNIYDEFINNQKNTHFIKLKLYYQQYQKILNELRFIKITDTYDENTNEYILDGTRIKPLELENGHMYTTLNDEYIYNDNPSMYWYDGNNNIDNINEIILDSENYIKSSEYILEEYNDELFHEVAENYYHGIYYNYVCKNLSGLKEGIYNFNYDTNIKEIWESRILLDDNYDTNNDNAKVHILIKSNEGELITYGDNIGENGVDIKINGDEKYICMYFSITGDFRENPAIIKNISLRKYEYDELPVYYDNDNMVDFYKEFFYKKYDIKYGESIIKEIWDSRILLDDNYDTYLMHNEYQEYYFVFISKNTCSSFKSLKDLNKHPSNINFECDVEYNGKKYHKKYLLKYNKSNKMLLINRLFLQSSNGKNQFSQDDIIGVSIKNNSMLPLNIGVDSKWEIKPISFGTSNEAIINGIGNTAIISIPKNNWKYERGYYEIIINYRVNNSSMNYQTIKSKILIK